MKINFKNPFRVLSQHKFTLPQILVIIAVVGGLAFTGGLMWRNYQKQLANEAAQKAAQAEAERLAKLEAEKEIGEIEKTEEKSADKSEPTPDPEPEPEPAPAPTASLYLVGEKTSKGVNLSWNMKNLSANHGFKLLLSKSGTPVFGAKGTDGVYLKDPATRGYLWSLTSGKTYYFRLCIYNGSGCSYYSNTIQVTAPYVAPQKPTGTLTLSSSGGSNPLSWTNTGKAIYGYKLVWSTSSGPKYPNNSAQFYDKTATSGSIKGDPGTYYVRVCMYYEGSCLNYSNEVSVVLP